MEISRTRLVRILGLGPDGGRAAAAVERAATELWTPDAPVRVEKVSAGEDAKRAGRIIRRWCDRDRVDVVFTVGSCGHERADFAPEMTAALLERVLPGVEERMHLTAGRSRLGLLFRGKAGMRGGTLVVNLPNAAARARAIVSLLRPVVGHTIEKARGSDQDCAGSGVVP